MMKFIFDHLVPHKGNNYAPHALQKTAVAGMFGLILLSFTVANLQSLLWMSSHWMVATILPAVIVSDTNSERDTEDLHPLLRNDVLDHAATLKAQHMADQEYFSHYSPQGVSPWYWFTQASYGYVHAGENLAIHFTDSSEIVQAWMDSPTHKANILNNDYTEIGIGTATGEYKGHPTVFVVQLFATPSQVYVDQLSEPKQEMSIPPEETVSPNEPTIAGIELPVTLSDADAEVSEFESLEQDSVQVEVFTRDVQHSVQDESSIVLFSDHISTTTSGIPASIDSGIRSYDTPPRLAFVTQPQYVLQIVYVLLGLFVLVTLLMSFLIEIHRHQPVQIAYGAGLLVTMMLLFYIHISISSGIVII